jgi:hypothetical protein
LIVAFPAAASVSAAITDSSSLRAVMHMKKLYKNEKIYSNAENEGRK